MEKYEINLDVNEKDFKNLFLATYFANITKIMGMAATILLFLVVLLYYIFINPSFMILALSAVPAGTYVYILVKVIPRNAEEEYNGSSYKARKPLFALNRSGVISIEKSSGKISEIKLSDLNAAWQRRKYFYFSITKNNTVIVPKRLLSREEAEFTQDLISTLPHKKRRNPAVMTTRQLLISILTFILVTVCVIMVILSFSGRLL